VFIALAVATIAGAVLSGGDDEDPGSSAADRTPAEPAKPSKKEPKAKKKSKQEEPAATPAPQEEEPQEQPASYDPGQGAELNAEGFELMQQGSYDEAIPVLQQAVESFPEGTTDLNYAYSLYNLGRSLRLAGRPDEAIPILEQRLQIPNQTDTVQQELDLARQQAGES
jgi:tetratricopeptide (TPR) repeat protein